jgi:hypothetical protein
MQTLGVSPEMLDERRGPANLGLREGDDDDDGGNAFVEEDVAEDDEGDEDDDGGYGGRGRR